MTNIYNRMAIKKDECYTSYCEAEKLAKYLVENEILPEDAKIWMPFDTHASNIYKAFVNYGYKKIFLSSLEIGIDFYLYQPSEFDIIITNPPFSNRTSLMRRLINLGKPFIILQASQFFNNQFAVGFLCQLSDDFEFILPRSRMNFLLYNKKSDVIMSSKSAASFYSFWLCYKTKLTKTFNHLPDSGKERDFEKFDMNGNIIKDSHYNLFSICKDGASC